MWGTMSAEMAATPTREPGDLYVQHGAGHSVNMDPYVRPLTERFRASASLLPWRLECDDSSDAWSPFWNI